MKTKILLLLFLATTFAVAADAPLPQPPPGGDVLTYLDSAPLPTTGDQSLDAQFEDGSDQPGRKALKLVYSGTNNSRPVVVIAYGLVPKAAAIALVGEVRCEEGWPGSYFQLVTYSPNFYVGLYLQSAASGGDLLDLTADNSWHEFRFVTTAEQLAKGVQSLDLILNLAGPCTLHFRNLRLTRADAPAPPAKDQGQLVDEFTWMHGSLGVLDSGTTTFWDLPYPKMTATHFALVGEARYEKASSRKIEMIGSFLPDSPDAQAPVFMSSNDAADGLRAKFDGTSSWRPFCVPFDSSVAKTRLVSVVMNIDMGKGDDNERVYFRNLRLMEYPDGFPAAWGAVPPPQDVAKLKIAQVTSNEAASSPDKPKGELMRYLLWWQNEWQGNDKPLTFYASNDPSSWVTVSHAEDAPIDWRLEMLSPGDFANIIPTPRRYGIEGEVTYDGMATGSYLEMQSWYRPGEHDAIPPIKIQAPIDGSSGWRNFSLSFDASKIKTDLGSIMFNLHFAGKGSVTMRNVKLVRYPDGETVNIPMASDSAPPVVGTLAPPDKVAPPENGFADIDRRANALKSIWFFIGVAATVFALLISGAVVFLFRRLRRRSHERELRRIASMDS